MGDILALPVKKIAQNRPARALQGGGEELVVVCCGQGMLREGLQLCIIIVATGRQRSLNRLQIVSDFR